MEWMKLSPKSSGAVSPNPHSSTSLYMSYFLKGLFICVDPETWVVITDATDEPRVTLSILTAPSHYVPSHMLDICPKLLFFTICSSQPTVSLEISWPNPCYRFRWFSLQLFVLKIVTMTSLSKKVIQTTFSRPSQVPWNGRAGNQCNNSKENWFQGNDDKTLQVQKRESVWFEFLGSINRALRVYFLSGWIIYNELHFIDISLCQPIFQWLYPVSPRALMLSEIWL